MTTSIEERIERAKVATVDKCHLNHLQGVRTVMMIYDAALRASGLAIVPVEKIEDIMAACEAGMTMPASDIINSVHATAKSLLK